MTQADTTSIASGIASAGQSIGQGLAMRTADMKRREEADKRKAEQAKKIRGMAKMFQEDLGLSDSEVQASDADQLGGLIEGFMLSQSSKHQKLQQERDALAIAGMKMLQRDAEGRRQVPKQLMEGFDTTARSLPAPLSNESFDAGMTQATGMPPGVRELIAAHANAGVELPASVMDDLIRQRGAAGGPMTFEQDPVTGARFARQGNSVLPSGTNPAMMQTVTVTDPNTGEPVELAVNPRTGNALLKPKAPTANRVPPEFTTKLGELAMGLNDPKAGPAVRAGIKASIDTAHTLKQLDTAQRDALYEQYGLGKDGNATAAPAKDGVDAKAELQRARNAISQGRSKAAVMKLYKERTGQDFPDE